MQPTMLQKLAQCIYKIFTRRSDILSENGNNVHNTHTVAIDNTVTVDNTVNTTEMLDNNVNTTRNSEYVSVLIWKVNKSVIITHNSPWQWVKG